MIIKTTAAIIVKDGKILIVKKGGHGQFAGKWEFPGGKLEDGETEKECIVRELFEELHINVRVDGLFTEVIHKYDECELLVCAYFCTWTNSEITLTEHTEYKWVSVTELDLYTFTPSDILLVKKLQQEYRPI